MIRLLTIFASLTVVATVNAQTQVPHDFQAGTPARAAEVNENFTAVEMGIDQNASDIAVNTNDLANHDLSIQDNSAAISALSTGIGIQVFSQGISIGRLIGTDGTDFKQAALYLISNQGYLFRILRGVTPSSPPVFGDYIEPEAILFDGAGCTGNAWVQLVNVGYADEFGLVIRDRFEPSSNIWYVTRGSQVSPSVNYQSFTTSTECVESVGTVPDVYPLLPNDEAITGVLTAAPTRPYTLGAP